METVFTKRPPNAMDFERRMAVPPEPEQSDIALRQRCSTVIKGDEFVHCI
jgi:hypothetical protein